MKIAVIFDEVPQAGGAFHQSINAVEQFKRVCGDTFDIEVFHLGGSEAVWLGEIGLKSVPLKQTWASKIIEAIIHFAPRALNRRLKIISPRETFLLSRGIDLVYFTSPNALALFLRRLKYILTFYDLCHRDGPEFPEVSEFTNFESRESYASKTLAKAILVILDSELLKSQVCELYGVLKDRALVMPYGVSQFISRGNSDGAALRKKYDLKMPFLFYPAQFWAHKNHVRILQALRLLRERGHVVDVAFAGSDKGERVNVEAIAVRLGIVDQVHFLGFVPSEELAGLYSEAVALVMPTYFGPTNIPPLEAWSRDVPVIYSKHLSAGMEEGVLAIDPDLAESIADAIEEVTKESVRESLIAGGRRCLERVRQQIAASETVFREHLVRFARRREVWTPYLADAKTTSEERADRSGADVTLKGRAVR